MTMADVAQAATLKINGVEEPLSAPTVAALLAERDIQMNGRGVAVALNGAVVPRARWATTALNAGDTVEIVRAMQGG
jgi:sulfur carrier protein